MQSFTLVLKWVKQEGIYGLRVPVNSVSLINTQQSRSAVGGTNVITYRVWMICPLAQVREEGWVPYQCHMICRALFWAERARWSGDETIVEAPETREVSSRRGLRFVFEVTQTLSLTTLSRPDSYPRWLNGVEDARINTSALCVSGVHATSSQPCLSLEKTAV